MKLAVRKVSIDQYRQWCVYGWNSMTWFSTWRAAIDYAVKYRYEA